MAHYRGWVDERGDLSGGGGGWEAEGGLNPPLGLLGLAMSPRSASIDPSMLRWHKRCFPITGVNFRPMSSM